MSYVGIDLFINVCDKMSTLLSVFCILLNVFMFLIKKNGIVK